MPTCHGRGVDFQVGVKLWRLTTKGVTPADGGVVGPVKACNAALALGLVDPAVPRNHRPVRQAHDEGGVIHAAVGIDQQARVAGQNRRRPQPGREAQHHRARADVVGDVAFELFGRQTEVAVLGRQRIRGMVAEDEQPAPGLAWHPLK
jgi:hypothetical protein